MQYDDGVRNTLYTAVRRQNGGFGMKTVTRVLAALMLCAVTAGCGGEKQAVRQGDGEMPKELTIFAGMGASPTKAGASSNNDISSFRLMEQMTGCHIEWIHPSSAAFEEKFNLLITSGNLPDAIVANWRDISGGVNTYVEDEIILDLTDLVKKNMPNFWGYLEENPEVKKQVTDADGRILYIPFIRKDKELNIYQGPQIRYDWLTKLGLDVPKTTDDLYNVLKAFKERDPNGNGQADEIPMTGIDFDDTTNGIGNLLWAFGTTYDFYVDGGKVKYGPMEPEFEEGLRYITRLYSEGLIDTDYLLNDRQKMDSKVLNDRSGFLFAMQPTKYCSSELNDGEKKVLGIGYLTGPGGKKACFNPMYTQSVIGTSLAITTACGNPAGVLKWLDNFYGGKGYEYMNFGEEGKDFSWVDGYPKLSDSLLNNPDMDKTSAIGLAIGAFDSAFPALQDWRYYEQTLSEWGRDSINIWSEDNVDTSGILPSLSFAEEENDKIVQTMSQIESYISAEYNKILVGQSSIDTWANACEQMRKMGIEDIIKIYNDEYKNYCER